MGDFGGGPWHCAGFDPSSVVSFCVVTRFDSVVRKVEKLQIIPNTDVARIV